MQQPEKHHPSKSEQTIGFLPGKSFPTFNVFGFKLGMNVCADGRHQDNIEPMTKAGVDVIHHPHGNTLRRGSNAEEWTRGKWCISFLASSIRACFMINNSAGDTYYPKGTLHFASGALTIDLLR